MLCRSTSTGFLSSFLPTVHLQPGFFTFAEAERSAPELYQHCHHSHVSTIRSGLESPASQCLKSAAGDTSRSTEGVDWDIDGTGALQLPKFRKVRSESDLQSIRRTSSGSAATFAAAESFTGYDDERERGSLARFNSGIDSAILEMSEISDTPTGSEDSEEPREMPSMANDTFWSAKATVTRRSSAQFGQESYFPYRCENSNLEDECASFSLEVSGTSMLTAASVTSFANSHNSVARVSTNVEESPLHTSRQASVSMRGGSATLEAPQRNVLERNTYESAQNEIRGPMMITDLGFGNGAGGGGSAVTGGGGSGGGYGDSDGVEAQYRRMLEADPGHPLLLRNYARFLHEVKGDPLKAEPYYERAILANPGDGEVLGQYAQLIWEVYKDEDRAGVYFDQAVQACPEDCFLNAAYASFLWSSESDGDGKDSMELSHTVLLPLCN